MDVRQGRGRRDGYSKKKRNDIGLAKSINKNLKDVAKHYREEHARLQQLRMDGEVGILDVIESISFQQTHLLGLTDYQLQSLVPLHPKLSCFDQSEEF